MTKEGEAHPAATAPAAPEEGKVKKTPKEHRLQLIAEKAQRHQGIARNAGRAIPNKGAPRHLSPRGR